MSCGQSNRLRKEDYEWMPYDGHEILVFRSNAGDVDTIFLLKKDTLRAYPEAQSLNGTEYEVLSIFCRHSDPNSPSENHQYLENDFFRIEKSKDNRSRLTILLAAKDANFYRLTSIRIDTLVEEKPLSLQTKIGQYTDVYEINGEDYTGSFSQRSNFITKVYWSKSQGLIRYDKRGGVYWELEKK
jgi:hypothetical protein